MRIQSILMAGVRTASLIVVTSLASVPAQAGTIGITYSFPGLVETTAPFVVGTTLFLNGTSPGSVLSSYSSLNTLWNPVTFQDTCQADLLTGQLTGVFTMTFSNGDLLSGDVFEDVSAVLPTNMGPYAGTLTFTGGTGAFAGATGFASIGGFVGATSSTVLGSGTVTGPGVVPEPASVAMLGTGLLAFGAFARNKLLCTRNKQRSCELQS